MKNANLGMGVCAVWLVTRTRDLLTFHIEVADFVYPFGQHKFSFLPVIEVCEAFMCVMSGTANSFPRAHKNLFLDDRKGGCYTVAALSGQSTSLANNLILYDLLSTGTGWQSGCGRRWHFRYRTRDRARSRASRRRRHRDLAP